MAASRLPLWKIKRELSRFPTSVKSKLRASLGPLHRIRHDLTASRTVKVIEGDRPAETEMAIMLIYQPDQLLGSLFATLRHLVESGVSVVLVANHPLGDDKIAALRPWCHRMIERPNIGYDFGGYRDGVLYLLETYPDLERLFILNDSNWFPIRENCTLIETARRAPEDLFGVFYSSARKRAEDKHLQSYFYRFDRRILHDPSFRRYWKTLSLINEKRLVVRYREVGLSQYFRNQGFSIGSLHERSHVLNALMALPDDALAAELNYQIDIDYFVKNRDVEARLRADMPGMIADRAALMPVLDRCNLSFNYLAHLPDMLLTQLNSPILKKNRDPEFRKMRDALRQSALRHDLLPEVQQELATWDS